MDKILNKLERGDFDHPNQKANLILQVRQHIKQLEKENQELKSKPVLQFMEWHKDLLKKCWYQEHIKLKKAIDDFFKWVKEQYKINDNQVTVGKATYTNIVELSLLSNILEKLKEYELIREVFSND